ncbi:glycerol-3-phosphate 1-O-acyltransferase PlsY [Vannielia litorea]|uniref:glycerol-3-phosphate 1-O-acyltransferase PlsY n=1 Tax=Vannielia litorea TaxID=1217970 RepID=UPI001C94D3F6|nr:glycerol-3-phosphate 1-O-acyltransferase PlsY [Vannielia litorea]MBY6049273.1 glycerol-3-phosphate 1-O-acyltransferase PlsY [Vannielia litorea]MBY6076687.1 glycerol-3-phosphate 1-O-acyltransferase PlsY [Vannielia litorea]
MPVITTDLNLLLVTALLAYLLGSVPFGLVMARAFGLGDLRKIGSGNIGATNVLRTGNKLAALLTLVFDAGKGGIAVLVARWLLAEDAAQVAGLFAFLGHLFPVWLKFKGGKGVATFLGTLLALHPLTGLAACGTWLIVAFATRLSSLAALISAATCTFWMFTLGYPNGFFLGIALTVLIYIRHVENIQRMKAGTETRIGEKKKTGP